MNQSYRNLEIILVNDGSPDNCPSICDEWQKKDKRIRVIHKENGGLSSARNAGLDIANGEYIAFVDSDDFILPDMYEYLYRLIDENDVDLGICKFTCVNEEGIPIQDESQEDDESDDESDESIKILSGKDALTEFIMNSWYYVFAWNKLYRADIFQSVRFYEEKINEDLFILPYTLGQCRRVAATNRKLCMYTQRDDSITGKTADVFYVRYLENNSQALMQLYDFFRNNSMHDSADRTLITDYAFIITMLRQGSYIKNFRKFNSAVIPILKECISSRGIKMKLRPIRIILEILRSIIVNI